MCWFHHLHDRKRGLSGALTGRRGPGRTARRPLSSLALAVALLGTEAHARDAVEVVSYEVREAGSDERLYTVRGWSEETSPGRERVFVSEAVFPEGGVMRVRTLFTAEDPPRCLSFERETRNAEGAVVSREKRRFTRDAFPFLRGPLPPDTYPPEAPVGFVLTRLGLGKRDGAAFHVILAETSVIRIDAWVAGRETVRVPAGEFEAYRVHLRANAESLFPKLPAFVRRFASFFIPRQTVWLSVEEPQRFLKFAGPMGPPGSPDLRVRLESVGPDASVTSRPRAGALDGGGARRQRSPRS